MKISQQGPSVLKARRPLLKLGGERVRQEQRHDEQKHWNYEGIGSAVRI